MNACKIHPRRNAACNTLLHTEGTKTEEPHGRSKILFSIFHFPIFLFLFKYGVHWSTTVHSPQEDIIIEPGKETRVLSSAGQRGAGGKMKIKRTAICRKKKASHG